MCVCDQVQNVATPRTIDAGKQNITIERRTKSRIVIHGCADWFYRERVRRYPSAKMLSLHFYLQFPHIVTSRICETVKVVLFYRIEIDDHDVFNTGANQGLGNHPADTTGPDDPDT